MTNRTLALSALVSLSLGVIAAAGCGNQPRVGCAPAPTDFSVKIMPVAGSKTGTGDCDTRFDGAESVQVMGMQPFFNDPGKSRINRLAITPAETGNYANNAPNADPDPVDDALPTHHPFAYGSFTTESPDNQNLCYVNTLAPAEVQYDKGFMLPPPPPDMDGGTDDGGTDAGGAKDGGATDAGGAKDGGATDAGGGVPTDGGMCMPAPAGPPQLDFPPLHVKYEFSGINLYVTAALTGSMFTADLTYTSYMGTTACTAKYKLRGLSPSVSCADDCGKPDHDICKNDPGIPKEISTQCDSDTLLCVLADGTVKDKDGNIIPKDTHVP